MKEICGDKELSSFEKIRYLVFNLFRWVIDLFKCSCAEYFDPKKISGASSSPAREYLYEYFNEMLPKLLPSRDVRVLDVGCGSGSFVTHLSELGYRGDYVGLDKISVKDFQDGSQGTINVSFVKKYVEDYETDDRFDLVLSIAVLEHVENDEYVVKRMHSLLRTAGLQIHVVPSTWALFLYLWHGYRQYSPTRIKSIMPNHSYKIYRIGGFFSFCLHFVYYTMPVYLFRQKIFRTKSSYKAILRFCSRADKYIPIMPILYVVVVKRDGQPLMDGRLVECK